jgi:cell fate (sporulation/competence/biofilm development) regulator YlbF (YheA/YmcA/DUF963 family)
MDQVRQKVKELAEALTNSEEYQSFLRAKENLEASSAASKMLNDFIKFQSDLQKAHLQGEEISQDKIDQMQKTFELINFNPYIREYFMADFKLMGLMGEIQKTLSSAVGIDIDQTKPFGSTPENTEDNE